MKKTALLLCVLLLAGVAAGCGGPPQPADVNYIDVIRAARSDEENTVFYIVADADTRAGAASSVSPAVEDEGGELFDTPAPDVMEEQQRALVFNEATGLDAEAMERYAVSLGFSITQAYGVAVVRPKAGQTQAVADMLNGYVLSQQKAQENYLPDQYEIAKSAIVRTLGTGEVLMVMCGDAATVAAAIEGGLKG